ncbi:hypothetical protein GVAMD_0446 [Gardnerella vaginalis AMD]|nr:hypothetical protein GVAMD_0446 [Gardnerella vaginalis AMD]
MIREWAMRRPHRPVELPSSWQELEETVGKAAKTESSNQQ